MAFGLLNIDKPAGMTSRQVVDRVAGWAHTRKVGHAGTLDPMATGVLVLCLGRATRLIPYVQEQTKVYRAGIELGRRSDTDDIMGEVIETRPAPEPIAEERVEAALQQFVGRIRQVPPKFSAVHVAGRRACEIARKGHDVALPPRQVEVYRIEISAYRFPQLEIEIECGSGTYIRSIARDLGEALGCGGLLSRLERTKVGPFRVEEAIPLDELPEQDGRECLLPPVLAVSHLPQYVCTEEDLRRVRVGRPVPCAFDRLLDNGQQIPADKARVALLTPDRDLAGIAELRHGGRVLAPRQVFYTPR